MQPPEMINAGELVIKRWEPSWADELAEAVQASLAELEPFMPWADHGYDAEVARAFLAVSADQWEDGSAFNYAVFTTVGELVGACGLMSRVGPGGLEIGYWIRTGYTGRGYATKAARSLAQVGLSMPGVDRLVIKHDAANRASGMVARNAGFAVTSRGEREREAPGESGIEVRWELRR